MERLRWVFAFIMVCMVAAGMATGLAIAETTDNDSENASTAKQTRDARESSVCSTLQTIRAQLELYRIQHKNRYPSMGQLSGWKVLTHKTDANGKITDDGRFGPYLRAAPANPFTGKRSIRAARTPATGAGWTWDARKGTLRAVMPAGYRTGFGLLKADDVETPRRKFQKLNVAPPGYR